MGIWLAVLVAMVSVIVGGLLTWINGKVQQINLLRKLRDAVIDRERISVGEEFLMTQMLAEKIQQEADKADVIFAVCPGGAMIAEWLSRRFMGNRSDPIPVKLLYMSREQKEDGRKSDVAKVDDKLSAIPPDMSPDSKVLLVKRPFTYRLYFERGRGILEKTLFEHTVRHFDLSSGCGCKTGLLRSGN
jgi:hypothetical protein